MEVMASDNGFWKWLQVMMSFFPATSARKKNICLIFWLLLCPNTSAIEEDRCELKNRSIKMDMDRSTLTFKVCFDEIMCHGNLFRWDKDLKQIFLNPSHEKIGLKYDFHQDLESGCVEMVIKNVTKEDLMAHYEFYYSFQKAEFEPGKQPIIVGEPAIACVNGTLELRSKMKPGLPEINMKLRTFVEKDRQKQETHDMIDVQDGNISVPINGSFTPYNLSVIYYYRYKTHKYRYVLLEHCIRKKIDKCKASKTMMQSESDRTGEVIGIAFAVLILAALLFIFLWRNRVLCFRGLQQKWTFLQRPK